MNKCKFIFSFFLFIFLSACNKDKIPEQEVVTPLVHVEELQIQNSYEVEEDFVGTVRSEQSANLSFELSGKIEKILVDVGDEVKKNQALVRLNTDLLKLDLKQLHAQKEQLTAQLSLIKTNLKRQNSLKKKGFSADVEIDALKSERDVLNASLRQNQAGIASKTLMLERATLYAPYGGRISRRFISEGGVINVGSSVLTLLSSDKKELYVGVPAKKAMLLNEKQTQEIQINDQIVEGKKLNNAASIDLPSRTAILRYLLPANIEALDGELGFLKAKYLVYKPGAWIPLSALTDGVRGTWNIFVVTKDNIVERRAIQVLHTSNKHAYISGEIADGERIIKDGLHRIVTMQRVNVVKD